MMMSASLADQQKLFGLFELDLAGNALYARMESDVNGNGNATVLAGHNFFETVVPFENAGELRRRNGIFTHSDGQADSFHFTCDFGNGPQLVKFLPACIREQSNGKQTKSILSHIRKV